MALENILATIKEEAAGQAAKIKEDSIQEIAKLKNECSIQEKEMKERILAEAEMESKKRIEQTKFQLKNQKKSAILEEKQAILDEIFELAIVKMAEIPETEQVELLVKLIKNLPSSNPKGTPSGGGKLVPTKNSLETVKKAKEKSGCHFILTHETVPGKGGFVFTSPDLEIDNRYSALVNQANDKLETEIAETLFS